MNWIVLTDLENDPVLINSDEISCIFTSDDKNSSIIWIKNEEHEVVDVKESLVEIYTQIRETHSVLELLERYNNKEPIMQEVPKPKITRWEKWAKSVNPNNYKDILCKGVPCVDCPAFGTSCLDIQQFKAYMLEEVDE